LNEERIGAMTYLSLYLFSDFLAILPWELYQRKKSLSKSHNLSKEDLDILFSIIYLLCIFYSQSQEETPMIKNDIALNIEKNSEFNRTKALQIVETILESLKEAMMNDEKIEIRGFASFKVVSKKTGFGRDIRREKQIKIKEGKRIKFRPGQELKKS
jgi:integration host factor subunit beta